MHFIKTEIEGVYIVEPRIFEDARGYFFESYSKAKFEDAGLHYDFIQDNQSKSSYGTVRGLHFQKGEHAQAKLVRVLEGTVLDVAVDLRKGSPTYGKHAAVELSAENRLQMLIPRGFEFGLAVAFEEVAASVFKNARLEDVNISYRGGDDLHDACIPMFYRSCNMTVSLEETLLFSIKYLMLHITNST